MASNQQQAAEQVSKQIDGISKRLLSAEKSSDGIKKTWDLLPKVLAAAHSGVLGWALGLTSAGKAAREAASQMSSTIEKGYKNIDAYQKIIDDYQESLRGQILAGDLEEQARLTEKLSLAKVGYAEAIKHNELIDTWHGLHVRRAAMLASGEIAALVAAAKHSGEFNRALIESSSLLDHRLDLIRDTYLVQLQTGASTQHTVELARALTEHGLDANSGFRANLLLVTQMKEGLGVSANTAADFASVFENRLHTSARSTADIITRIKEDTALAAEAATRYATTLARSLGSQRAGSFTQAGQQQLTANVLALEGAAQKIIGSSGGFTELAKRIASGSMEGQRAGALLGIYDPTSIGKEGGAGRLRAGLAQVSARLESTGDERQRNALAEQYSRWLGLSVEELKNLVAILPEVDKTNQSTKTLQEVWRDQVSQASQTFDRLKSSLGALVGIGLTPLIRGFTWLAEVINSMIQTFSEYKTAVTAFAWSATALGALTLGLVIKETWSLTRAMFGLYLQLKLTGSAALKAAATGGIQGEFAFMKGGDIAKVSTTAIAAVGGIGAIVATALIAAAAGGALWYISKLVSDKNKVNEAAKDSTVAFNSLTQSIITNSLKQKAMSGSVAELTAYIGEESRLLKERKDRNYTDDLELKFTENAIDTMTDLREARFRYDQILVNSGRDPMDRSFYEEIAESLRKSEVHLSEIKEAADDRKSQAKTEAAKLEVERLINFTTGQWAIPSSMQ